MACCEQRCRPLHSVPGMVTSLVAAQPAQGAALAPVAVFPQQRSTPAARWQTIAQQVSLETSLLRLAGRAGSRRRRVEPRGKFEQSLAT